MESANVQTDDDAHQLWHVHDWRNIYILPLDLVLDGIVGIVQDELQIVYAPFIYLNGYVVVFPTGDRSLLYYEVYVVYR